MPVHQVHVAALPRWLDVDRLLGPADPGGWTLVERGDFIEARAELERAAAADLAARLRGLGIEGERLELDIEPPLSRAVVRRARTEDARRRRETTPGFTDKRARVDAVGRMSLTPERLAARIGRWAEGRPVVDAGCGVGGNAIGFARAGSRVIAIEADADRLALARHNARVYGVADRIAFVHGDAREHATPDPEAILFVDPPWGADWDRGGCAPGDLPLLPELLARAPDFAALWVKLPPSCATAPLLAGHRGAARAMFGEAAGDRRRIKFVLVRLVAKR